MLIGTCVGALDVVGDVVVDASVLGEALGLSLLTALIFGLARCFENIDQFDLLDIPRRQVMFMMPRNCDD